MNKLDWIIIGGQRCGTTSLYNYITQHPKILPCKMKEVHFFDNNGRFEKGKEWYESLFPETKKGELTGEATPYYLYCDYVPKRIFRMYGNDVKFIVILRNPVERAYSHYHLEKSRNNEILNFEDALMMEEVRLKGKKHSDFEHFCHSYKAKGLYYDQLERWANLFNKDNLMITTLEKLFKNPQTTCNIVFDFLGLKYHEIDNYIKHNKISKPNMKLDTRKKLFEYFKEPNEKLHQRYL